MGLQSPAIACYATRVSREPDIEADSQARIDAKINAILAHGRQTRTRSPRWLWILAAVVGAVCAVGFAVAMLGAGEPARPAVERRPASGGGLGIGLLIGGCVGIVIGFSIARQRADHSSRNTP